MRVNVNYISKKCVLIVYFTISATEKKERLAVLMIKFEVRIFK